MPRIPCLIVVAATIFSAFFLSYPGFAEVPDQKALLLGDARLSQKFTFEQRQARMGEVFDAVEKQTGIHLTVEDRDGAAGEMISVFVRGQPIADLMTGIWSLVSFQHGEWRWVVTDNKQSETREYRLTRPIIARDYPVFVNAEIKKYFEALMEASIRASHQDKLSSEDAAEFPEALLSITDKRIRLQERAFAALCTPDQRLQLLRGQTTLEVGGNNWPPEAQAYIDNEVAVSQAAIDSHPEWKAQYPNLKARAPEKIEIRSDPIDSKITPNLWFGSYPVVGSTTTEKFWQDRIASLWLQPGDMRDDPTKDTAKYTPTETNTKTWPAEEAFDQATIRLKQLHDETGLPVLARLTGAKISVAQDPKKIATVGDAIANFRDRNVLLKWRDGTLLAMDAAWIKRTPDLETGKAPWSVLREVRDQIADDPTETPSLHSFIRLAATLNENQLQLLDKQQSILPEVNPITESYSGSDLLTFQPMLAGLGRRPDIEAALRTEQGTTVHSLSPTLQKWAQSILGNKIPVSVRLRLEQIDNTVKPIPTKTDPTPPAFTGSRTWHFIFFTEGAPDSTQPVNPLATRDFSWQGHPRSR